MLGKKVHSMGTRRKCIQYALFRSFSRGRFHVCILSGPIHVWPIQVLNERGMRRMLALTMCRKRSPGSSCGHCGLRGFSNDLNYVLLLLFRQTWEHWKG